MKNLVGVLILLFSFAARAEVDIQTAVDNTTGEELFLCNASLRHTILQNEQECLNLENGEYCNPQTADPKKGPCVCRSKTNYGDQILAWSNQGDYKSIIGANDWNNLVESSLMFKNKVNRLEILLGSENLGAEYAVRFCYLGSQEVLHKQGTVTTDISQGKYMVDVSLAGGNYSQALDKVSFAYQCDYRQRGGQSAPRRKNELPSGGVFEKDDSAESTIFGNGSGARPGGINFLQKAISLNSITTQVPRICVFEFKFKELAGKSLGRNINASQVNFTGKLRICKQGACPSGF
ncbi:hypothetical protein [Bdellovibrio sp. HCB288]|uniref:hypothetical protein n=1 Tax=Bdellovibrio sp. HCB288 TaxID=3394355 RepID=UPI0039B609F0